jgi:serine protease AprX
MIRTFILYIVLLTTTLSAYSQDRYIVKFTDKNNSPYSLSSPLQFLSQRAIDRRINHNISLTITDLPVNPNYIQGVINTGANVLNVSKWNNAVIIETTSTSVLNAINQLSYVSNYSNVGKVVLNPINPTNKFSKESYAPYNKNQSLRTASYNYGQAANQINMIGLSNLHNAGFDGTGMIIAVIDAGFYDAPNMICFDSLFQQNRIISTWDFVDHENDVYDDNYHGAAVLSCMASNVDNELIGTAPKAEYILLRSEDAATENIIEEYNWSAAAEYADSAGADVINSSLGYTRFDDPIQDHEYADLDGNTCPVTIAADMAASKGILVVNSAGNEGNSSWNYISAPADGDSVLAAGAVDDLGIYASFSGNGPSADGRIKPDVADLGQGTSLYTAFSGNMVTTGNGTSFSGPILAGAAACLWQAWPQRNNMQIIDFIQRSSSQFQFPDTLIGYGIPNFTLANNLLSLSEFNVSTSSAMNVFPNPWNNNSPLHVLYLSEKTEVITLEIVDVLGRVMYSESRNVSGGIYEDLQIKVDISNGTYLVNIYSSKEVLTSKFIKQ